MSSQASNKLKTSCRESEDGPKKKIITPSGQQPKEVELWLPNLPVILLETKSLFSTSNSLNKWTRITRSHRGYSVSIQSSHQSPGHHSRLDSSHTSQLVVLFSLAFWLIYQIWEKCKDLIMLNLTITILSLSHSLLMKYSSLKTMMSSINLLRIRLMNLPLRQMYSYQVVFSEEAKIIISCDDDKKWVSLRISVWVKLEENAMPNNFISFCIWLACLMT